jgi:hypothetical protein
MNRKDLFEGVALPSAAAMRLALYERDGRFRLIVNELIDRARAESLSRDDLYLYTGYLLGVIADLDQARDSHSQVH